MDKEQKYKGQNYAVMERQEDIPASVKWHMQHKPYAKTKCAGCFGAANGDCGMCRSAGYDKLGGEGKCI